MRDSLTVEIVRVRQENPEVTTLYVARPFDFMAGQYITVFIEGRVRAQSDLEYFGGRQAADLSLFESKIAGIYGVY